MDRCDADQEGLTMTPIEQTRLVAEAAARQVVIEHLRLCPFSGANVEGRVRSLETNYARLTGFMVGSGLLGGAASAIVAKMIGS